MVNRMLKKAASLTLAIGSTILLAPFVKAEPSQEIVDKCMKASDFEGCIRVFSGKKPEEKKMTIDIDKVRTSGNNCPAGFAYRGAGQCQEVGCNAAYKNDPNLGGKGWHCKGGFLQGRGGLVFQGPLVQATTIEYCPMEEPGIGNRNSCWNGMTEDEIKNEIFRVRVPPSEQINDGTTGVCKEGTKDTIVTEVLPNSPASEAGIVVGDIIVSIDGIGCPDHFKLTHKSGQVRSVKIRKTNGSETTYQLTYRTVSVPERIIKYNTKTNKVVTD